ncbi:MAG TPA: HEAT repeat domain-containing protein [Verrucomicrobiae bacterium]
MAAQIRSIKLEKEGLLSNSQTDNEEISRLERENAEILKLRDEVSQLRGLKDQLERLRGENQQLRDIIDSERDRIQAQWTAWLSSVRTNGVKPDDVFSLVQALTNDAVSIRVEAAKVLRQLGIVRLMSTNLTSQEEADLRSTSRLAVPGLVAALKDSDTFVRANAAITLGFLDENTELAVPALIQCLSDDQLRVAGAAAKALGRLQGDASSAVPALLQAAQSTDENVRENAIAALKQIDPAAARNAGF